MPDGALLGSNEVVKDGILLTDGIEVGTNDGTVLGLTEGTKDGLKLDIPVGPNDNS